MLDNRVYIITGAASGLGRAHARLFSHLGARLVIADVGTSRDGEGRDASLAQQLATEINESGGEAVATSEDITSFDASKRIVDLAVDAYGDLHGVVNNAGILRDRMSWQMAEDEFDSVVAVHMKGTFNMCRHAAALWRQRTKDGDTQHRSIVNVTSGAGLHGNVGQVNYSAAKAGVVAMALVLAQELRRFGAVANSIAPIGRTRATAATPGLEAAMADVAFDAENVSPLVALLSAPGCRFTGQVFSVYGRSVGLYGGWTIAHEATNATGTWTVGELDAQLAGLPDHVDVVSQMDILGAALAQPEGSARVAP